MSVKCRVNGELSCGRKADLLAVHNSHPADYNKKIRSPYYAAYKLRALLCPAHKREVFYATK